MRTTLQIGGTSLLLIAGLVGCHQAATSSNPHNDTSPLVGRTTSGAAASSTLASPGADSPQAAEPVPAPGTALALAQRATTYAQSVDPVTLKRTGKAKSAAGSGSDAPDPDATRFTPQAEIERPADVAVAPVGPAPKGPPAAPTNVGAVNASVSVPTDQKLVATGPDGERHIVASVSGIESIAARIAARGRDYPADLCAQADDQLLKFVRDEPVPDVSTIAGLAPEDRELLSALMDSLTNFRNQLRADNNMLFSKKIRPLVDLSDRLRSQAELSVPTVALCTRVHAFGVYDPMDPARFIAGKEQQAVVYCEVENFLSQPNEKNLYQTRLTQEIVLYTESSGLPVWSDRKSTYDDQSRRRRHDFFMAKVITLPANLTIGRYLLKVTVEDQQARHIAENTVPVEIVAQ